MQYLTLELPKKIINDAISAETPLITVFGMQIPQLNYLALLCLAFLVTVIGNGLLKMYLNTTKGILAERMLRRFRYDLITRILRFPQPYFQRTSQGELVSMVTAESEPLGGMMGDAISLPILQAGQMITILAFLMVQSVWFGLAASALIPVQAWLVPRMQRNINLLNRERVRTVRRFATVIGESSAGAIHLRKSGGVRYWQAVISNRLSQLYDIRFEIYQKKFFMKFVNNLITQLTPLMFFSIGGYLAIKGQLSLGALVAALAAHKDLAAPWNELLTYYNQVQEASLRWIQITDRFEPAGIIEKSVFEKETDPIASLKGNIQLVNVTVRDPDGTTVLKDISIEMVGGSTVGLAIENEESRKAMADLLTRELAPTSGKIQVAGLNYAEIPQKTLGARIGYTNSRPFVFQGTFGTNVTTPLRLRPGSAEFDTPAQKSRQGALTESIKAGNSADPIDVDWIDLSMIAHNDVREWWLDLTEAIDTNGLLFNKGLEQKFESSAHEVLAQQLVDLRKSVAKDLRESQLDTAYFGFDRDTYNPALPVAGNLFFAIPNGAITHHDLIDRYDFLGLLRKLHLEDEMLSLSRDVIEMLRQTFGLDGADHPLFRKLGLDPVIYEKCVNLVSKMRMSETTGMADYDLALLLAVPFQISAEQIGPAFSEALRARIVGLRHSSGDILKSGMSGLFIPLDPEVFSPGLTVLENVLFGKMSESAGAKADRVKDIIAKAMRAAGLTRPLINLIYDLPTDLNGGNLTSLLAETLDLTRAAIKCPDVLILDQALASYDAAARNMAHARLRQLLPETTFIYLRTSFDETNHLDVFYELSQSQLLNQGAPEREPDDNVASADLGRKLRALAATSLFSELDRKQLRLLAFGARWYSASAGTLIFAKGDAPTDGAYLISDGEAGLYNPVEGAADQLIATAVKGTLVGELGLIRNDPRSLGMRAHTDVTALRISAEAFLSVVENDAPTAFKLLQVVAGYVTRSAK